ncbi:MAG: adenine-specific methyltransferase protein class, partial [Cyanobacteriota bacterium]
MKIIAPSGAVTTNYIDFYKEGCFVLEAKQGSDRHSKGTGKRGTASYRKAMKQAFHQALRYARFVEPKPPFLITCDIGDHFRVWQDFSESWLSANGNYGTYDSVKEIPFADLAKPEIKEFFYKIFTDPQSLNPEKIAAQVTREVAADLADLAKTLEETAEPQAVAQFLMRCIFTMFAEDVGLLKEQLFTEALETRWLANPQIFKAEVEGLWRAMNEGTSFGFQAQLLRFNGGLFADSQAFALSADQLQILLTAAKRDWRNVEPAIFGTLLERTLEKNMVRNRHLAKSISDAGWATSCQWLKYFGEKYGRVTVAVLPHYTSQNCSNCGETVKKALSVRTHNCPHCGYIEDRDVNAAKNILQRGLATQGHWESHT